MIDELMCQNLNSFKSALFCTIPQNAVAKITQTLKKRYTDM